MNYNTSQLYESYVPVYDAIPGEWENSRDFIVEMLRKISEGVNNREIGYFLDEQLLSGKNWISGTEQPQQYRSVFRKVVNFGPLPNAGVKSIPHGINIDSRFTLTHLYAGATDPVNLQSLQIPFAATSSINNNISLFLDAVNINISTGINRSVFTRCYVVIEYLLEL